jgi:hypothetical protein
VVLLWPKRKRFLTQALLISGFAGVFFLILGGDIEIGGGRKFSPDQMYSNIASIAEQSSQPELEGSRAWRLAWWNTIINYTIYGPYFWTGKGFGINLADEDGFQTGDGTTRSPHNGHLTILARMGVPGLTIWCVLQTMFAAGLLFKSIKARRMQNELLARLLLWVLAYWAAFMVYASFDVYLEGPQGGIWFWCLFGLGFALMEVQHSTRVQADEYSIGP